MQIKIWTISSHVHFGWWEFSLIWIEKFYFWESIFGKYRFLAMDLSFCMMGMRIEIIYFMYLKTKNKWINVQVSKFYLWILQKHLHLANLFHSLITLSIKLNLMYICTWCIQVHVFLKHGMCEVSCKIHISYLIS